VSAAESPAEILERLAREREAIVRPAHRPVAVTGGRDYTPTPEDYAAFWRLWDTAGATELHHGDSRGVDRLVAAEMRRRRPEVKVIAHAADWNAYGKKAGPFRNQEMMASATALIVFPGGVGTANCVSVACRQGKPVHYIQTPTSARRHQHRASSWWWRPDRAVWEGRCITCHHFFEATNEQAEALEREAARYADEHPLIQICDKG
jgi:hypothetical protein